MRSPFVLVILGLATLALPMPVSSADAPPASATSCSVLVCAFSASDASAVCHMSDGPSCDISAFVHATGSSPLDLPGDLTWHATGLARFSCDRLSCGSEHPIDVSGATSWGGGPVAITNLPLVLGPDATVEQRVVGMGMGFRGVPIQICISAHVDLLVQVTASVSDTPAGQIVLDSATAVSSAVADAQICQ